MRKLHLICTSHIDPIWQWTLDEGIASAIATFKSAVDLLEEYDYIFCHNESMLYEAIEECAPDLFERIKDLVKKGRWIVSGGWYLQPDCNMPSGETFIRLISEGKRYFKEKFGIEPTVAYNFDAFGHSIGLVQILAKNGYTGYLTCRPRSGDQFKYPGRFFKWTSPDGSSVIVSNSGSYGTLLGDAANKIYREATGENAGMLGSESVGKIPRMVEEVNYSLWGVGNHGGGPSRKDLKDIKKLTILDTEIIHSTPETLFADDIKVAGEVKTSLVTVMPGCYSSMAKIKQAFRRTENLLYSTEKLLAIANLNGIEFDTSDMKNAEKKLLLTTFHDVLPGTCVQEGEREGLCALSFSEKILRDYRMKAFLRMTTSQKPAGEKEFPVFVFNYAPYTVTTPVEVEFMLENQNWDMAVRYNPHVYYQGEEIPCQTIKEESTLNLDWRKKVVFCATLKPMSMTRFCIKVSADERKPLPLAEECDLNQEMLLGKPIFEIYDDTADPWGMSEKELLGMGANPKSLRKMTNEETKEFCALQEGIAAERIIEKGKVLTSYEGLYTNGNSNVVMQCKKYKDLDYLDIKLITEFNEKNKLLRVKFPIPKDFGNYVSVGDGPLVWEEKPNCENVFQKWYGVRNDNGKIFAIINDGVYSGKVEDGFVCLTLLRGAGYCFHPIPDLPLYPEDRYLPRIDSGRYTFNLRLVIGDIEKVVKLAEEFNQPPYAVNVFPTGKTDKEFKNLIVEGSVVLTNFHKNERSGEYIVRLYNPTEIEQSFKVDLAGVVAIGRINMFEVVTVIVKDGNYSVIHDKTPV